MIDRFHFSLIVVFVFFCFRVLSLPFQILQAYRGWERTRKQNKKNMKNRCLPLCLAMCLPLCLAMCLPFCLAMCLPFCLAMCLPFCLAMCLPAVFYGGIKMLLLLFIFLPSIKPSAGSISVHDKVLRFFR